MTTDEKRIEELEDAITDAGIILAGSGEGESQEALNKRAMKRLAEVMNHPHVLKRQGV